MGTRRPLGPKRLKGMPFESYSSGIMVKDSGNGNKGWVTSATTAIRILSLLYLTGVPDLYRSTPAPIYRPYAPVDADPSNVHTALTAVFRRCLISFLALKKCGSLTKSIPFRADAWSAATQTFPGQNF